MSMSMTKTVLWQDVCNLSHKFETQTSARDWFNGLHRIPTPGFDALTSHMLVTSASQV